MRFCWVDFRWAFMCEASFEGFGVEYRYYSWIERLFCFGNVMFDMEIYLNVCGAG